MGIEGILTALGAQGREVRIMDDCEMLDDLERDVIEMLPSFCARFYGRRSARTRALRALQAAQGDR